KFILLLVLVLLCTAPVIAQSPVQDTIPQLKEWWRVDNMGYGAPYGRDDDGGMTWLDNFYNGKGALVVSSPDGVKTWQMRFPGDTTNVFTWKGKGGPSGTLDGGNPTIKIGDFNGDGTTDYIDAWGNIYEGVKNGEPPAANTITPSELLTPWFVGDFNGDGYDDVADGTSGLGIKPMLIIYGKSSIKEMKAEPISIPQIDSNNVPIVAYMVGAKEMRIICTHTYWTNNFNYPFKTVYKDGLRLVRAWWDGSSFKSEVLDEFSYNTQNGNGWFYGGRLFQQSPSEIYWLCQHGEGIITIYNLYKDKFESISTVTNAIGLLGSLNYSVDKDKIPDFFAKTQTPDGKRYLTIYSGDVSNGIHPIYQFVTVQTASFISLPDVTGDRKPDFALSNYYIVSSREKYRFSILTTQDTTSSVESESANASTFSIQTISPMPVSKDKNVQLKVRVPQAGSYTVNLYDITGKKIAGKSENYQLSGEQIINLNIEDYAVSSGTYSLLLEANGRSAQCTIIIQ
ncbi:MAG: T9SS type A sorting domain-containing protein, partial [Candidatus Kapaibacterium sp.]